MRRHARAGALQPHPLAADVGQAAEGVLGHRGKGHDIEVIIRRVVTGLLGDGPRIGQEQRRIGGIIRLGLRQGHQRRHGGVERRQIIGTDRVKVVHRVHDRIRLPLRDGFRQIVREIHPHIEHVLGAMRPRIADEAAHPAHRRIATRRGAAGGEGATAPDAAVPPLPVDQVQMVRTAKTKDAAAAFRINRLIPRGRRLAAHTAHGVQHLAAPRRQSRRFIRRDLAQRLAGHRHQAIQGNAVERDPRTAGLPDPLTIDISLIIGPAELNRAIDRRAAMDEIGGHGHVIITAPIHWLFKEPGDFRRQLLAPGIRHRLGERPGGIRLDQLPQGFAPFPGQTLALHQIGRRLGEQPGPVGKVIKRVGAHGPARPGGRPVGWDRRRPDHGHLGCRSGRPLWRRGCRRGCRSHGRGAGRPGHRGRVPMRQQIPTQPESGSTHNQQTNDKTLFQTDPFANG